MQASLPRSILRLVIDANRLTSLWRSLDIASNLKSQNLLNFTGFSTLSQPGGVTLSKPTVAQHLSLPSSIWRYLQRQYSTGSKCALSEGMAKDLQQSSGNKPRSGILKTILFCTAGSGIAFTIAAVKEEYNYRKEWERFKTKSIFKRTKPTEARPAWLQKLPVSLQNLYREFWQSLSPAERAVGGIIAVNLAVFGAFNVPSWSKLMVMNFLHHLPPMPFRSITLLTSNFAHFNPWHMLFNMVALWSFGQEAARILGVEQFLGFYVSAGLMSAMASQLGRAWSTTGGFSMGASGAVYACFALTAMHKPDTEVVFIFLPMLPLKIGDVLNVMIAFDIAGALLRWRRFDHLGHLGGALFGLYYALKGQQVIWPEFRKLADYLTAGKEDQY